MSNIDTALNKFKSIIEEYEEKAPPKRNEATTRLLLIDEILKEVLGWEKWDLNPETPTDSGYIDYLLKSNNRNKLVVEAKKDSLSIFTGTSSRYTTVALAGPTLKCAKDGIQQAKSYSQDQGVNLATLTNGYSWVIFLPSRSDGVPVMDGKAIIFPSISAIIEDFAIFYEILSKDAVLNKSYMAEFSKVEMRTPLTTEEMYLSVKDSQLRMIQADGISSDLQKIFDSYFGQLKNNIDHNMIRDCFVETHESKNADTSLQKISRDLINQISPQTSEKLTHEIQGALERKSGEIVLIIGNKGAGKSTFIERFFSVILAKNLRDKCLKIDVDLSQYPKDTPVEKWITKKIKNLLKQSLFDEEDPTYDQLLGIFKKDYDRWKVGEHAPLYNNDKKTFQEKFGAYMYAEGENNPYEYNIRFLENAISARNKMPCIVFDNADQFPTEVQEAVFQYAETLRQSVSLIFTIIPVTDKTAWKYSKDGPLQSYKSKSFYLPTPPTKEVFQRRLSFLKEKLRALNKEEKYFTAPNGYKINVKDAHAFADCIESVLVEKEYISRRLGFLANFNMRRCLELAEKTILSPHMGVTDLIKTYIFGKEKSPISTTKISRALLLGEYNFYEEREESFIINLFKISKEDIHSPLLALSILCLLQTKQTDCSGDVIEKYIEHEEIESYFSAMNVPPFTVHRCCKRLVEYGLIEAYVPTIHTFEKPHMYTITPSGKIHIEMALKDTVYIGQMALRTEIRNEETATKIREHYFEKNNEEMRNWKGVIKTFKEYCLEEDAKFINIPSSEAYNTQRALRRELK